jgi:hypothetical protein
LFILFVVIEASLKKINSKLPSFPPPKPLKIMKKPKENQKKKTPKIYAVAAYPYSM